MGDQSVFLIWVEKALTFVCSEVELVQLIQTYRHSYKQVIS